jgi:hypothetical protein
MRRELLPAFYARLCSARPAFGRLNDDLLGTVFVAPTAAKHT